MSNTKKPIKKQVKPAPKKAVSAKKPSKPAPKKAVAKPVSKKPVKPAPKKNIKTDPKKAIKPAAKKAASKPVAKKPAKPAPKKIVKVPAKKVVKPVSKKPVKAAPKKVAKVAPKPVAKKPAPKPSFVSKKPVAKSKPAAKPVAKAPAKTFSKPVPAKPAPPKVHKKPQIIEKVGIRIEEAKGKIPSTTNTPFNDKPEVKQKPVFTSIVPKKPLIEDIGKTRYSDSELLEFRELITEKLASSRNELQNLQEAIQNISDNSSDDTDNTYKTLEDGGSSQEKEHLSMMAARQRKYIESLENAMIRIENKTYGICVVTGKLIPKERLRAVPNTTQSIEAKLGPNRVY